MLCHILLILFIFLLFSSLERWSLLFASMLSIYFSLSTSKFCFVPQLWKSSIIHLSSGKRWNFEKNSILHTVKKNLQWFSISICDVRSLSQIYTDSNFRFIKDMKLQTWIDFMFVIASTKGYYRYANEYDQHQKCNTNKCFKNNLAITFS